jgi:hypothetical protein
MTPDMQVADATPVPTDMPADMPADMPVAPPETAPEKQCAEGEFSLKITSVPSGAELTSNLEKQADKNPCLPSV